MKKGSIVILEGMFGPCGEGAQLKPAESFKIKATTTNYK